MIADLLKREMANRDFSQYRLALESGIPQPTISRILAGGSKEPKRETLRQLATTLGLADDAFILGSSDLSAESDTHTGGARAVTTSEKRWLALFRAMDRGTRQHWMNLLEHYEGAPPPNDDESVTALTVKPPKVAKRKKGAAARRTHAAPGASTSSN